MSCLTAQASDAASSAPSDGLAVQSLGVRGFEQMSIELGSNWVVT